MATRAVAVACFAAFSKALAVSLENFQTVEDCADDEILKDFAGIRLGQCVPASFYNTPRDVVMEPGKGGAPYLLKREGGPGFVTDDKNVNVCRLGYYCPYNPETQAYDQEIKCREGEYCNQGAIEPLECHGLVSCPDGCTRIVGAGGGILFVFLAICLSALVCVSKRREHQMLKCSQDAFDEFLGDSLDEFGKKFQMDIKPVLIEFENVGLQLKGASKDATPILQNVSGHFPPGALVALMGPSGCGKTTFMNALIDRAPYGVVSGTVKVNGVVNGIAKASNVVGFVPQDDIVHSNLTVFQNLYYHARLRLPKGTPEKEVLEHVQHCISVLGLAKIQNKIVGSPEKRGISGGQKKRVNIGLELAAMPSVIFMDEPTSGLDGGATLNLARCMGLLKETGLTIVCVIHQPRWAVFEKFSHVLLLGEGGQQVYCGRREYVVDYLQSLGFKKPEHENPADWMIDVCSNLEKRYRPDGSVDAEFDAPGDLCKAWQDTSAGDAVKSTSKWHQGDVQRSELQPLESRKTIALCTSAFHIVGRVFRQTNIHSEINQLFTWLFLGLFLGGLGPIIAMLMNACAGLRLEMMTQTFSPNFIFAVFVGMQHRFDYGDEKLILSREVNSGIYFTSVWFAKTAQSTLFGSLKFITYAIVCYIFIAPLQRFIPWALAHVFLGLWWVGFAQWISLLCRSQVTAVMILLLVPIFEGLFSGNYCAQVMGSDVAATFCPRGGMNGFGFFPGHHFFSMLWSAEISQYPAHIGIIPIVNQTNYWYNVEVDVISKTSTTAVTNQTYTGNLYQYSGDMDPWVSELIGMIWINFVIRLFSLVCLACMASSTNRWVSDKISRCSRFLFSCFGICHLPAYSAPQEELNPPFRTQRTISSSGLQEAEEMTNTTDAVRVLGHEADREAV